MNLRPLVHAAWLLACAVALIVAVCAFGSLVMLYVKGPYMSPRPGPGTVGLFCGLEVVAVLVLALGMRSLMREPPSEKS